MEIVYIILSLIFGGIAYYSIKRLNSRRFRIVETNLAGIITYTPQVKAEGKWFYICEVYVGNKGYEYSIHPYNAGFSKIDAQDALELIDKFKSAGNYSIPSNKKLNRNQKAIKVE